VWLWDVTWAEQ